MAIKCGNCKDYHPNIAAVRDCCQAGRVRVADPAPVITPQPASLAVKFYEPEPTPGNDVDRAFNFASEIQADLVESAPRPINPASERQLAYLRSLLEEREIPADSPYAAEPWRNLSVLAKLGKAQASTAIGDLRTFSRKTVTPSAATEQPASPAISLVPAGRFALRNVPGYANEISFFKIDKPTEGRWRGRTFANYYVSDNTVPVRGAGAEKVLSLIAANVEGAFALYGAETSTCGVCGRKLTDDESRARGIGPVCANKMGF